MTSDLFMTLAILAFFVLALTLINRRNAKRQKQQAEQQMEQQLMHERMDKTINLAPRGYQAPPLLEDTILLQEETDENESYLTSETNKP